MRRYQRFSIGLVSQHEQVLDALEEHEVLEGEEEDAGEGAFEHPVEVVDLHEVAQPDHRRQRVERELPADRQGLVVGRDLLGTHVVQRELEATEGREVYRVVLRVERVDEGLLVFELFLAVGDIVGKMLVEFCPDRIDVDRRAFDCNGHLTAESLGKFAGLAKFR